MSHDMKLFVFFYALSCIPWIISMFWKDREAQIGLGLLDFCLSITAYVFLAHVIGLWWLILVVLGNIAVGTILRSLGMTGYTEIVK